MMLTPQQENLLWNDLVFGWKNFSTLTLWVELGLQGVNSGSALILADYFKLDASQLQISYQSFNNWC